MTVLCRLNKWLMSTLRQLYAVGKVIAKRNEITITVKPTIAGSSAYDFLKPRYTLSRAGRLLSWRIPHHRHIRSPSSTLILHG